MIKNYMITDVKMKAASTHYETLLALLDDCTVNIGQVNHSRKEMLPLLLATESYVDEKTSHTLNEEIPCTMMLPHFYGVIDKGTVNRRTSQAAYLIFQNNGRCAYPLGAPLVYKRATESHSSDSDSDDSDSSSNEDGLPDVDGGSAGDLARNLLNTMKIKIKLEGPDLSRYCGTTADGQYQAEDFLATIHKETCREEIPQDLLFCQTTIWDAFHLLNLASTDIKEGKCGNSKTFFNKFIKRANEFNHLLSRGKGYAQLEISAQGKKKLLSLRLPHSVFSVQLLINGKILRKDFQCCMQRFILFIQGQTRTFPSSTEFLVKILYQTFLVFWTSLLHCQS